MRFYFTLGEGFPADEIVAQFVTVIAMISNDWLRIVANMENVDGPDQAGQELLNYRLQAALHYEATHFLREAVRHDEVSDFVAGLPKPARDALSIVLAGLHKDPEIGHGPWFGMNRNRTFHYSRLGRRSPIRRALSSASAEQGVVRWERTVGATRFQFADQVALEWLASAHDQEARLTRMSHSVSALSQFADLAVGHYLISRGLTQDPEYDGG